METSKRRGSKSSSITVLTNDDSIFSIEIIFEILIKLSIKTLPKLKCVSKSWLSHISSCQFIKTHLKNSASNLDFVHHRFLSITSGFHIQDEGDRRLYRKFQTYSLYAILYGESPCLPVEVHDLGNTVCFNYKILCSCDGLFAISVTCDYAEDLFLWNPSIRELKNLPDSGRDVRTGGCSYGFCYIECQNDYKIVEIGMGKFDDKIAHIRVYSLRNNSWKEIWKCPSICLTNHVKFVKGKLHWITGDGSDRNSMWFNLGNETFGNVALPNPSSVTFNWKLVSPAGNLCMTYDYRNKTHVWIMKEYGLTDLWTIVTSIPKLVNKVIWLIFSSQNDEILLQDISGLVWWYVSRDDDTFERRENQTHCECDGYGELSLYVESLVSPNSPFDR